jgi:predicted nucleic acid-binding protein
MVADRAATQSAFPFADSVGAVDKEHGIAYDTTIMPTQIVLDTCVLVSALRSKRGASHLLLRSLDSGKFKLNISVPLVLEYEAVCKRLVGETALTEEDLDAVIDYLCRVANPCSIYYLWRPCLKDANDDMVLELAISASCDSIVTFNIRDFAGAEQWGVQVRTPQQFLREIGVLP